MGVLEVIDASAVRQWASAACAALKSAAAEIDALNVYPVPDRDTGTNLYLTMQSALSALDQGGRTDAMGGPLDRLARGALVGARGNSGVILSQLLRGFADTAGEQPRADGAALAAALSRGADLAYACVAEPVEGTILSVARAAADSATALGRTAGLEDVAHAACAAAALALQRTPSQLAVLARAGVVDAGGRGLCLLLDALLATITGRAMPDRADFGHPAPAIPDVAPAGESFGYEVQFLLDDAERARIETMRDELQALGDSLVIADAGTAQEGSRLWKVHVHVDDVGAAIEAGVRAGSPYSISVTRFADSLPVSGGNCMVDPVGVAESGMHALPAAGRPWSGRGLVAVSPGKGLARLFAREGVTVVEPNATGEPAIAEILTAISRTGAAEVVVLADHPTMTVIADAAAQRARVQGQDVAVVPTKSPVQGLSAIAVADPSRRFADVVIALAEAAAATRWAEITVAAREAMTSAGRCAAGDVLGLAEGDVVVIGKDQTVVTCDLLDRLLSAGGELVTLVLGAGTAESYLDGVSEHLRRVHPGVDVMDYRGDQHHLPVLIGVE